MANSSVKPSGKPSGKPKTLIDGVFHTSTPALYKKMAWFLDRVEKNKCHLVLYRNGIAIARVVPMDCSTDECAADYGVESTPPLHS